jgi:hypothetical protein
VLSPQHQLWLAEYSPPRGVQSTGFLWRAARSRWLFNARSLRGIRRAGNHLDPSPSPGDRRVPSHRAGCRTRLRNAIPAVADSLNAGSGPEGVLGQCGLY